MRGSPQPDGTAVEGRSFRLGREDLPVIFAMVGTVLVLHVLGVALLVLTVAQDFRLGSGELFGVGLGVTAYTLGMRHAFDADHIAAIDNTTRKLVGEGGRPVSVGFWFSLGHSSVVVALCAALAGGIHVLIGYVQDDSSALQQSAGIIGSSVAGTFLIAIGLVNLASLVQIVRVFRRMRSGEFDEVELEKRLNERGIMARLLNPLTRTVRRPRHMYPAGLLFGLGFDTATSVSLLVIAGGAALALPWYAIMSLPLLFAAGMSLFDTADGIVMRTAYGWALDRPVRKVYYNVTVTAVSVVASLVIGVIVLAGLVVERTHIDTGPLAWLANINLDSAGYAMVVALVGAWLISVVVWKALRIEERWERPKA
ncbi:HoxN/HupN/NixA family nickel/cobalt transporter [soil metagenome]